jgi:putative ABC transport system permease protein
MFKNYFKTAWRNLIVNKAHSFINIAGLSVGITCSLFIFLWVQNELSVDAYHTNDARLYKLYEREYYKDHIDGNDDMPGLLAQEVKRNIPEVEDAIMLQDDNHTAALQAGEKIVKAEGTAAGAGLFTMFSYPLLQGNAAAALDVPVNITLSQNIAEALFGNAQNAIGKTVRFDNKHDFTVTAVFKNLPQNASRRFDYAINWDAWLQDNSWAKEWGNSGPQAFVLLRKNANAEQVDKKLTHFLDAYNKQQSDAYRIELGLQKFDEVYLQGHFTEGKIDGGRIEYVHLFSLIAFFILLIACINFMNLATARSVKRAKEVGVRKAVGAVRSSLIKQFISEALLLTVFAVAIALLLTALLLPVFSMVTERQLQLPFTEASFWLYIGIITVATGLIAGSYPALYLSSFNPVKVLKGTTKLSAGAVWFRKGLVVSQFVLSLVLIVGTIVVSKQVNFIQNRNIGYDKENLVYIPMQGSLREKYNTFKNEALKIPGVQNISCITDNPSNLDQQTNGVDWDGRSPNTLISFEHPNVGYDFVQTMKLQLTDGRDFSKDYSAEENGYLLNQTAVKDIGYANAIGKFITVNGKKQRSPAC